MQVSWQKTIAGWICFLSLLAGLCLAPLASAQAAGSPSKQRVSKVYHKKISASKVAKSPRRSKVRHPVAVDSRLSDGQLAGLQATADELHLKSSVALVVDQKTDEVLYSKNDKAVLPIASLTKLMTGLLLDEAQLPPNESITIIQADVDTEKGSRSRLRVGSVLSRGELLHLALMSSENRAAHALARTYPGGLAAFVPKMNAKARALGMVDTVYVEPTGLSSSNKSSAQDLAKLVDVASKSPMLRELTTSPGFEVAVGRHMLQFNNTNRLVKNPNWDIGLQKTGYITEAGRCLVMLTRIAGRNVIMVFLDSTGKLTRIADAQRVRSWIESMEGTALASPAAGSGWSSGQQTSFSRHPIKPS